MEAIKIEDIRVEPLDLRHSLDSFDCGEADINDFLKNDALKGHELKTSRTHLFFYKEKVIGYVTIRNDSLKLKAPEEKEEHKGLASKRYREFPAVKIARLGVDKALQQQGIGANIVKWGVGFTLEKIVPITGCRFITIDALPRKVPWYIKQGFKTNQHVDYSKRDTISMRMDLHNPVKKES